MKEQYNLHDILVLLFYDILIGATTEDEICNICMMFYQHYSMMLLIKGPYNLYDALLLLFFDVIDQWIF